MSTYVVIRGKRYPMADLGRLSLWDWMDVQAETGMTMESLEQCAEDVAAIGQPGGKFSRAAEVFASADHLKFLAVQVWAARRAAGERMGIREASDIPMSEWTMESDDDEPAAAPDPTGGSAPGGSDDLSATSVA